MINLVRNIWAKTRKLNYDFKNDIWQLRDFDWPDWDGLQPEIKLEHINWFKYLIKNDIPDFTAAERHDFAVLNRMRHGWQLGVKRDDSEKIDPYLKPIDKCGDWFPFWGSARDVLLVSEIKRNWLSCRTALKKN